MALLSILMEDYVFCDGRAELGHSFGQPSGHVSAVKGVTAFPTSGGDMLEAQNRLVHLLTLGAEIGPAFWRCPCES